MSNVIVKENETLDSALRRFKRSCAKAGIQQEIRKREHYEKPSVRRKKKSEAARKRKYNKYVNIGVSHEKRDTASRIPLLRIYFSNLIISLRFEICIVFCKGI